MHTTSFFSPRSAILSFIFALVALVFPVAAHAATDIYQADYNGAIGNYVWTKSGSPYILHGQPYFRSGSLTIEPGVVVKFAEGASLIVHADIAVSIQGTLADPVFFTSIKDDSVGGDTNGDGSATAPAPGDWKNISFGNGSSNDNLDLQYFKVRYGGGSPAAISVGGGLSPALIITYGWYFGSPGQNFTLEHVEVSQSADIGLFVSVNDHHTLAISNSSFRDNASYGLYRARAFNSGGYNLVGALDARGNWWGDTSGPYHPSSNPSGVGDAIDTVAAYVGPIAFDPWLSADPMPDPVVVPSCCSSILFLPGVQGSRMFEGAEKLWEPGGDPDIQALYLDSAGDSVHPDVYTTDVIDTVPITGNRIYQSFLDDLAQKKNQGAIADYAAVPYDWRLALPDILASGKEEADGAIFYNRATSTPYIEQTLRKLAEDSLTGKVTIVAHSNGGLLAKALLNELGADASNLVDQVILVAVPQLGTPQAIGALLHGFDTGLPFDWLPILVSPERARDFGKNASMTYQLLPHANYYNTAGATITTPVVSFEPGEATQPFIDEYGSFIGTNGELHNFLIGMEGREVPLYDDLDNPAIANEALLTNAETLMQSLGSSWQPPAGITVHQIAGIGEDTLAGITYKTVQKCVRAAGVAGRPVCLEYQPAVSYTPNEVKDGDGTVVVPSALAMSPDNDQAKRWWVDLEAYNRFLELFPIPDILGLRTQHGNILEIDELRTFIFDNFITQSSTALPEYLFETQPAISDENRLRFILHSPLTLSATSAEGEISGTVSTLPGASFKRYGEVQVITVPKDALPTLHLDGVSDGSFTLEVEEYTGDALIATTTFSGIPTTATSVASMSFPDGTIEHAADLQIDYDGNATIDLELAPEAGEEITLPDPSLEDLLAALKAKISSLSIEDKLKSKLLKKIDNLGLKIEKKRAKNAKLLTDLQEQIAKKELKGKLDSTDAAVLLGLLGSLEAGSDMLVLDGEILATLKDAIANLTVEQKLKDALLKRVVKLKNKQALTNTLSQLSANIIRKGEKGKITEVDVQNLLDLLGQIEAII